MFKFITFCALLVAASAAPDTIIAPLSYSSNVLAPAPGVVASYPSGLVYPSPIIPSAPLAYSGPFGYPHLIKKRSAPLIASSYIAPSGYYGPGSLATTYAAAAPLATTYGHVAPLATTYAAAGPLAATYASPFYTTPAHLIKKRAAPFVVPHTYVTPTTYAAATPFVPSTYAAAGPFVTSPLYSSAPLAYNTHFIK